MAEETKTEASEDRKDSDPNEMLKSIADAIGGLTKRMDAMERDDAARRDSARKDGEDEEKGEPKEVAADKGRKDTSEPEETANEKDQERKDAARRDSEEEEERKADKARKDAAEEEHRKEVADSLRTVAQRIADVEKALPRQRPEMDRVALVDAQAKADKVFHAYGDSAPRPLDGEDLGGYRRRMVGVLKDRTTKWKGVNPGLLVDPAAFGAIEAEVYADALGMANSSASVKPGSMRAVERREGGHVFTEYHGDPTAWMNPIAGPRHAVTSGLEPGAR